MNEFTLDSINWGGTPKRRRSRCRFIPARSVGIASMACASRRRRWCVTQKVAPGVETVSQCHPEALRRTQHKLRRRISSSQDTENARFFAIAQNDTDASFAIVTQSHSEEGEEKKNVAAAMSHC